MLNSAGGSSVGSDGGGVVSGTGVPRRSAGRPSYGERARPCAARSRQQAPHDVGHPPAQRAQVAGAGLDQVARARRTRPRAGCAAGRAAIGWPTVIATALSSVERRATDRRSPAAAAACPRAARPARRARPCCSGIRSRARAPGACAARRASGASAAPSAGRRARPQQVMAADGLVARAHAHARDAAAADDDLDRRQPLAPIGAEHLQPRQQQRLQARQAALEACAARGARSRTRAPRRSGRGRARPNAVPCTAGGDAIARNGCSAGSGANRSVVGFGSSDRSRPTSRRSQKPFGRQRDRAGEHRIEQPRRRRAAARSRRRPSRPRRRTPGRARAPAAARSRVTSSRCPGSSEPERRRRDVAVLRFTCAVTSSSLNTRAVGRLVERRQQRRRRRQRHAAGVERRRRRLVARAA